MLVPKLHDMKTATIDIEMYVALLEIRGDGLPNLVFWMYLLDGFPCRLAYALAVNVRVHEKQFQISFPGFLVNAKDKAAYYFSIQDNPEGFCFLTIDRPLDGATRNHLVTLITTLVTHPELTYGRIPVRLGIVQASLALLSLLCHFLLRAMLERTLIVRNELLSVVFLKGNETYCIDILFHLRFYLSQLYGLFCVTDKLRLDGCS